MWYSFRNSPYNHGYADIPFDLGNDVRDKKIPPTYIGGIIWGTCVIDSEDCLYVGTSSGRFFKIGSRGGEIIWKYNLVSKTDSLVDSAAVLHPRGFVIVPGGDGFLHALRCSDGKVLWRLKAPNNVDDRIDRSGVIVNSFEGNVQVNVETGLIYAGNDNGNFYCIREDGVLVWSIKTDMMIWSCCAFIGGYDRNWVVFGSLDFNIYIVNALTGKLAAKYNTGGEIKSSPVVVGKLIYICNSNGLLSCLEFSGGEDVLLKWKIDLGVEIYSTPAYKDGMLIVCTFAGDVICINCDSVNNKIIWKNSFYNQICCSAIITEDDLVVVGDSKGLLYAIGLNNGVVRACCKLGNHAFKNNLNASPSIDSKSIIHIGCYDGYIHHIRYSDMLVDGVDHVPRFLKIGRSHLELENDGIFVKQYRIRVFDEHGGYLPDAAIDITRLVGDGGGETIPSSDGKYLNIVIGSDKCFDGIIKCGFYNQTPYWYNDRFMGRLPSKCGVASRIRSCIQMPLVDLSFNSNMVLSWDLIDMAMLQPKILDTYIPAAFDSVTFKLFVFGFNDISINTNSNSDISMACINEDVKCWADNNSNEKKKRFMALMIPTIKDHDNGDSLVIIPEEKKVLLLDGVYDKNTFIIKSRGPFEISSMGGTMKFKNFDSYHYIHPETLNINGEFIVKSSCIGIKGNGDNYKFSPEIVNKLCDPFMRIHAMGVFNGKYNGISILRDSVIITQTSYLFYTSTHLSVNVGAITNKKSENLICIVYNTNKNRGFVLKTFVDSLKNDISIKMPNDIKQVFVFINDSYAGKIVV